MDDRINPNRKNRLTPKDVLKRTAALTLLLSTVACSSKNFFDSTAWLCIISPLLGYGALILITYGILYAINGPDSPPSDHPTSDPDHYQQQ